MYTSAPHASRVTGCELTALLAPTHPLPVSGHTTYVNNDLLVQKQASTKVPSFQSLPQARDAHGSQHKPRMRTHCRQSSSAVQIQTKVLRLRNKGQRPFLAGSMVSKPLGHGRGLSASKTRSPSIPCRHVHLSAPVIRKMGVASGLVGRCKLTHTCVRSRQGAHIRWPTWVHGTFVKPPKLLNNFPYAERFVPVY